ncbi:hypothetical protein [Chryseobacterium sp. MP_3.2]|uniref:hypothetical protein n=1 Tax=Chryseobacterium sp. MP_3.2 TaxID=3071712 RepID=UPI002E039102|nr:AAA15 family ATPase/GTPase [Chryseobacterium sp. MP_3.2]
MSTISKYKIQFGIKNIFNTDHKFMSFTNTFLDNFITDFYDVSGSTQLLNAIKDVINKPLEGDMFFPSQGLQLAIITTQITKIYDEQDKFYENENSSPDFQLPTSDFKVIVEVWRDFLAK